MADFKLYDELIMLYRRKDPNIFAVLDSKDIVLPAALLSLYDPKETVDLLRALLLTSRNGVPALKASLEIFMEMQRKSASSSNVFREFQSDFQLAIARFSRTRPSGLEFAIESASRVLLDEISRNLDSGIAEPEQSIFCFIEILTSLFLAAIQLEDSEIQEFSALDHEEAPDEEARAKLSSKILHGLLETFKFWNLNALLQISSFISEVGGFLTASEHEMFLKAFLFRLKQELTCHEIKFVNVSTLSNIVCTIVKNLLCIPENLISSGKPYEKNMKYVSELYFEATLSLILFIPEASISDVYFVIEASFMHSLQLCDFMTRFIKSQHDSSKVEEIIRDLSLLLVCASASEDEFEIHDLCIEAISYISTFGFINIDQRKLSEIFNRVLLSTGLQSRAIQLKRAGLNLTIQESSMKDLKAVEVIFAIFENLFKVNVHVCIDTLKDVLTRILFYGRRDSPNHYDHKRVSQIWSGLLSLFCNLLSKRKVLWARNLNIPMNHLADFLPLVVNLDFEMAVSVMSSMSLLTAFSEFHDRFLIFVRKLLSSKNSFDRKIAIVSLGSLLIQGSDQNYNDFDVIFSELCQIPVSLKNLLYYVIFLLLKDHKRDITHNLLHFLSQFLLKIWNNLVSETGFIDPQAFFSLPSNSGHPRLLIDPYWLLRNMTLLGNLVDGKFKYWDFVQHFQHAEFVHEYLNLATSIGEQLQIFHYVFILKRIYISILCGFDNSVEDMSFLKNAQKNQLILRMFEGLSFLNDLDLSLKKSNPSSAEFNSEINDNLLLELETFGSLFSIELQLLILSAFLPETQRIIKKKLSPRAAKWIIELLKKTLLDFIANFRLNSIGYLTNTAIDIASSSSSIGTKSSFYWPSCEISRSDIRQIISLAFIVVKEIDRLIVAVRSADREIMENSIFISDFYSKASEEIARHIKAMNMPLKSQTGLIKNLQGMKTTCIEVIKSAVEVILNVFHSVKNPMSEFYSHDFLHSRTPRNKECDLCRRYLKGCDFANESFDSNCFSLAVYFSRCLFDEVSNGLISDLLCSYLEIIRALTNAKCCLIVEEWSAESISEVSSCIEIIISSFQIEHLQHLRTMIFIYLTRLSPMYCYSKIPGILIKFGLLGSNTAYLFKSKSQQLLVEQFSLSDGELSDILKPLINGIKNGNADGHFNVMESEDEVLSAESNSTVMAILDVFIFITRALFVYHLETKNTRSFWNYPRHLSFISFLLRVVILFGIKRTQNPRLVARFARFSRMFFSIVPKVLIVIQKVFFDLLRNDKVSETFEGSDPLVQVLPVLIFLNQLNHLMMSCSQYFKMHVVKFSVVESRLTSLISEISNLFQDLSSLHEDYDVKWKDLIRELSPESDSDPKTPGQLKHIQGYTNEQPTSSDEITSRKRNRKRKGQVVLRSRNPYIDLALLEDHIVDDSFADLDDFIEC